MRSASQGNASRIIARQFASGFWFKQDLTFVNVRTVLGDMRLLGVRIYEFDRDLRLKAVRVADSASYNAADGSQVGHVATSHRARWDYRRRMELAISFLSAPVLDVLITGESPFEDLPLVMTALADGSRDAICHRLVY